MDMQYILYHTNKKYGDAVPNLFSRTLLMQYHKEKVNKNKTMCAPPTILMVLLNVMQLHIKVLHISNQRQASGKMIKNKPVVAVVGTQYEGFSINWSWRHMSELWSEEITSTAVIQKESIHNEWTTYKKVNDCYSCSKNTIMDSR